MEGLLHVQNNKQGLPHDQNNTQGLPHDQIRTTIYWASVSEPHLIVLTCEPHTVRSWAVSFGHGYEVIRPERHHRALMYEKLHLCPSPPIQYSNYRFFFIRWEIGQNSCITSYSIRLLTICTCNIMHIWNINIQMHTNIASGMRVKL